MRLNNVVTKFAVMSESNGNITFQVSLTRMDLYKPDNRLLQDQGTYLQVCSTRNLRDAVTHYAEALVFTGEERVIELDNVTRALIRRNRLNDLPEYERQVKEAEGFLGMFYNDTFTIKWAKPADGQN